MIKIPDFVYAKDENGNSLCPRCKEVIAKCNCPSFEPPKPKEPPVKPNLRLDRSGRNGKVVTLISNLPAKEQYLKDLAKTLKVKTGSGGRHFIDEKGGTVELQGDHKEFLIKFFKEKHES